MIESSFCLVFELASTNNKKLTIVLFRSCCIQLFPLAVIVQTVENGEWAFLMAMGTVIKKTLADGEQLLVDGNSILCFESSVTVDIRAVGGIAAICCGGEGIFNTELTGAFHIISLCGRNANIHTDTKWKAVRIHFTHLCVYLSNSISFLSSSRTGNCLFAVHVYRQASSLVPTSDE